MLTQEKTKELRPVIWSDEEQCVQLIDQRLLPYELKYVAIKNHQEMAEAIKDMTVRGAPAIGIAAAFGMALAAKENSSEEFLAEADRLLRNTRPTAVNLMWALDEIKKLISSSNKNLYETILKEAEHILEDDINRCKAIGKVGADYIKEKFKDKIVEGQQLNIMTHCNAGALATGGYGTALGVIRALHEEGLIKMVFANETRPRQQGARLTAWELAYEDIPVTLCTDNMTAHLMKNGNKGEHIDCVVVGSDRITTNGDAANKIGTYQVAISASYHNIPFFVAAPMSTVDMSLSSGDQIPIEERDHQEVSHINGQTCTTSKEINYANPGFDVTPNALIEQVFTEQGLFAAQ